MASTPQPSMELIEMIAFIGDMKGAMSFSQRGVLNTYGLHVQRRRRESSIKGDDVDYKAGGRFISKLEFSGFWGFLIASYTPEKALLTVTKYEPGEWEQKVKPTYLKAKNIDATLKTIDKAMRAGDHEAMARAEEAYAMALKAKEPFPISRVQDTELSLSAQEWGATVVTVYNSLDNLFSLGSAEEDSFSPEQIATLRKLAMQAQELKEKLASCHPQSITLQRPHAELLRWTESFANQITAGLRQMELGATAMQSGYRKKEMREYLRAEKEALHIGSEAAQAAESFVQAMTELANNDKDTYEQLNLPEDFSIVPTK